jgi:hypothetical protein
MLLLNTMENSLTCHSSERVAVQAREVCCGAWGACSKEGFGGHIYADVLSVNHSAFTRHCRILVIMMAPWASWLYPLLNHSCCAEAAHMALLASIYTAPGYSDTV